MEYLINFDLNGIECKSTINISIEECARGNSVVWDEGIKSVTLEVNGQDFMVKVENMSEDVCLMIQDKISEAVSELSIDDYNEAYNNGYEATLNI